MNSTIALKDFGLDEEEIKLYLAGVKLGEAPLTELAKEAKIKRTTAYLVAERLEIKGLMGKFKMRSGLKFVAVNPGQLEELAQKKFENIQSIVPELNLYSEKLKEKPKVTLFEGKDGYLNVFNDPLQYKNTTIRAIGSLQNTRRVISQEYDEKYFVPERLKNNIGFKALYFKEEVEEMGLTPEKNVREKREIKILPTESFQTVFTTIYKNTVIKFTSKKEMVALKIVSPEIAKAEKINFDLIWKLL